MKRILLACAGLALLVSFVWVGVAAAANVRSGESPRIMSDEVINGTLYTAGGDIKMQGTVQGDVFCAGQNVEIAGVVEGDVLCAAQNITISGEVQGDVRLAGQFVSVRGKVAGSASIVGQNVDIENNATIARDVTLLGQQMDVAGTIGRDVEAMGSTFSTAAKIGRDLDVTSPQVALTAGTDIAGMFMYVSQNSATVDSGAKVTGKTEHKLPDPSARNDFQFMSPTMYVASAVFTFASFLLLGVALLLVAPRAASAAATAITTSPFGTLGAGFLGLVGPPFAAIVLFMTVIGIPLGVVVLLGWIISLMLGVVVSAQVAGQFVVAKLRWQDSWRRFAALVIGLFALFVISLVPVLGGFIMFAAVVWGVGAQWYAIIKHRRGGHTAAKTEAK